MKITVIIPVYNSERYISRCLESILNQTYTNWDLIIIDDGSTDSSLSILKEFEKRDNRIHVVHQENQGAGNARNVGINRIKNNEYVVFIDSDDYIESCYFEELAKHTEDLIFIDIYQKDDDRIIKEESMSIFKKLNKDEIIRKQLTGCIPWGGVRKAVKSNIILKNNIRYSNHIVGEEAEYSFKVLFYSKTIGYIDKYVYNYMTRTDSLSSKKTDDPWGEVAIELRKKIKKMNLYEIYANTINAFIITATIVSFDKIACQYNYLKYKKMTKERMKMLKRNFDNKYSIDFKNMNKKALMLYPLLKLKMFTIIYIISNIRKKFR